VRITIKSCMYIRTQHRNPNAWIRSDQRTVCLTGNIIVETNERSKCPRPMIPNPHGRIQNEQRRETVDTIFGQYAARIAQALN